MTDNHTPPLLGAQAYYYISPSNDPFYNIALEDYLYNQRHDLRQIYMLWVNSPSVFMGRYQHAPAEMDMEYLSAQSIPILRRSSGGGTVFHDLGNLNYTCISTDSTGRGHDLKRFPEPIIQLMAGYGVSLELSPRGDLRLEGRKVGGSAEAARGGRMLYHMSLLVEADLAQLERVLEVKAEYQGLSRVPSVRSRVANLAEVLPHGIRLEDFRHKLLAHIAKGYEQFTPIILPPEANEYIEHIKTNKYASPEWIHSSMGLRSSR